MTKTEPTGDLPKGLSQPALRALHAAGITRLDQCATYSEAGLLELHGMGPKAIATLRQALADRGLAFSSETAQ